MGVRPSGMRPWEVGTHSIVAGSNTWSNMSDAEFTRDASLTQQIVTPMVRHLAAAIRNGARRGVEMRPNLAGLHRLLGYAVITHEDRGA
jgi:hypothetical protein